jgi:hypothetical protein
VPAIKTYRTLELPRRLRAFMRFEAGVGRGWPLDEANQIESLKRRLAQAEAIKQARGATRCATTASGDRSAAT